MEEVIKYLVTSLDLKETQIKEVLSMLAEGATIPFIARYRKDKTGNLNEDQIRYIEEQYKYQENLLNRKNDVIRLIDEKGMLTPEIQESILKCTKVTEVEDIKVLSLADFANYGKPAKIVKLFGGKAQYEAAVKELEENIYDEIEVG